MNSQAALVCVQVAILGKCVTGIHNPGEDMSRKPERKLTAHRTVQPKTKNFHTCLLTATETLEARSATDFTQMIKRRGRKVATLHDTFYMTAQNA
jgi:hypothetical protein